MAQPDYIAWVDLEATGSRTDDPIAEEGWILTGTEYPWAPIDTFEAVVDPGDIMPSDYISLWEQRKREKAIHRRPEDEGSPWWYALMPDVVREMHTSNGLLADIAAGKGRSLADVEEARIEWLKSHGVKKHSFTLAGVGVSYYDWRLLDFQCPKFRKWPQHPKFDVGSWRAGLRFAGRPEAVAKGLTYDASAHFDAKPHRSLADIADHLAEWRAYAHMIRQLQPHQITNAHDHSRHLSARLMDEFLTGQAP